MDCGAFKTDPVFVCESVAVAIFRRRYNPRVTELRFTLAASQERSPEEWRLSVPARPAVYLLADGQGRPVLLSLTGNLRQALARRLGPEIEGEPRRKTDYRAVVRLVRYRPVHSRFEADWIYLEAARRHYPAGWRKMMRHRRAAWLSIDLSERFARFAVKDQPCEPVAGCFGPVSTARYARIGIQCLEDQFDLCREHALLVQAPHAAACSYKQMGRCPAPCDGSESMDQYRSRLGEAVEYLGGRRQAWRAEQKALMKRAAAELKFEAAQLIKSKLERSQFLDSGGNRHLAPLGEFRWLILQRGRGKGRVRFFRADAAGIEFMGELQPKGAEEQIAWLVERLKIPRPAGKLDGAAANIVAWHLTGPRDPAGVYYKCDVTIRAEDLRRAIEALAQSQKKP